MSEIFVQGMFKWRARVRDKAYFVACRAERCAGRKAAGGRSGREEKFRGWPFSGAAPHFSLDCILQAGRLPQRDAKKISVHGRFHVRVCGRI
jgi:hypothetical protein